MKQISYSGASDHPRMLALADASRANNVHIADWPYRFASWAFDQPDNVALWLDDAGALVAWAVLQTPFWTIDTVMRPDAESSELHRAILAWADAQAQAVASTRFGRPMWLINVMTHQHARMRDLEALGFTHQADVDEESWSNVLMSLSPLPLGQNGPNGLERLRVELSQPKPLPTGFNLRPLDGEREVDAYATLHRAVFESESMTAEGRRRTLVQPGYTPDLDLVLEAPDGSLAGFCVCWLHGAQGQVEPMGIREDVRGTGLGKALLGEGMRRLVAQGATELFVETNNFRNAALALYESAGFRVKHEVYVYRKNYV